MSYFKDYYQKNKEKLKQDAREYYENNKEKSAKWRKEYRLAHLEKERRVSREYHRKNRDVLNKKKREFAQQNKELLRDKVLKRDYGISLEEYYLMIKKRNGNCDICNKPDKVKRNLSIDHCHKTGKVRGLLCQNCNSALGFLQEDINLVRKAVLYLENTKLY